MAANDVLSPLCKEMWRQNRHLQRGVGFPKPESNEASRTENDACNDPSAIPRVQTATPIESKQNCKATSSKQDQTEVVDFPDKLQFNFVVHLMLRLELRWVIKNKEQYES